MLATDDKPATARHSIELLSSSDSDSESDALLKSDILERATAKSATSALAAKGRSSSQETLRNSVTSAGAQDPHSNLENEGQTDTAKPRKPKRAAVAANTASNPTSTRSDMTKDSSKAQQAMVIEEDDDFQPQGIKSRGVKRTTALVGETGVKAKRTLRKMAATRSQKMADQEKRVAKLMEENRKEDAVKS
ncbi:MAG: hypothetical protein SGCHY_005611, partial [Lobulomycetales sp.]